MRSEKFPQTVLAHIAAWGVVCALAVLLNYGSLCRWYLALAAERRELRMLRPVLDALPAFAVGAILTWVMLAHGGERWLFGVWMALFGLMHTSSRHSLPPEIWWLGWYYIACSAWHFLILGGPSFTDPTPMGITFVIGETAGSVIFYRASKKTSKTVGP